MGAMCLACRSDFPKFSTAAIGFHPLFRPWCVLDVHVHAGLHLVPPPVIRILNGRALRWIFLPASILWKRLATLERRAIPKAASAALSTLAGYCTACHAAYWLQ
jgi:hypothetical protein